MMGRSIRADNPAGPVHWVVLFLRYTPCVSAANTNSAAQRRRQRSPVQPDADLWHAAHDDGQEADVAVSTSPLEGARLVHADRARAQQNLGQRVALWRDDAQQSSQRVARRNAVEREASERLRQRGERVNASSRVIVQTSDGVTLSGRRDVQSSGHGRSPPTGARGPRSPRRRRPRMSMPARRPRSPESMQQVSNLDDDDRALSHSSISFSGG
eukprot:COSAG02_NODE_6357_length_3627_cov_11.172052_2_plen_213_part_00